MGSLQAGNPANAGAGPNAPDFANRSTARMARTIMARKFGTSALLPVALWSYFRSSVRPVVLKKAAAVPQACNKFDIITSKSLI